MDTAFAARLPFEMFNDVCEVRFGAIESRLRQRFIKDAARGSDERLSGQIFIVARLFPDQHDLRTRRPFAEDSLRAPKIQIASLATASNAPQHR
jgi:hypothetical protein